MKIAPSILTADFLKLEDEIKSISSADYIHVDVMDGNFVPNISFGPAINKQIAGISKISLDVHLMVLDPLKWIDAFSVSKVEYISIHFEANEYLKAIEKIKSNGIKAGIVINPETEVEEIEPLLDMVDLVLVMSVKPGFGGQSFIADSTKKISKLYDLRQAKKLNFLIEVDGGINDQTIKAVKQAGVDIAVVGSYLFNQNNRNEIIEQLKCE